MHNYSKITTILEVISEDAPREITNWYTPKSPFSTSSKEDNDEDDYNVIEDLEEYSKK